MTTTEISYVQGDLAALPEEVKTTMIAALTLTADRTLKMQKEHHKICYLVQEINKKLGTGRRWITADDATDSAWLMGSPTYLTILL